MTLTQRQHNLVRIIACALTGAAVWVIAKYAGTPAALGVLAYLVLKNIDQLDS
jgi:hypothetical protein